jgi:hypothetical protein
VGVGGAGCRELVLRAGGRGAAGVSAWGPARWPARPALCARSPRPRPGPPRRGFPAARARPRIHPRAWDAPGMRPRRPCGSLRLGAGRWTWA